MKHKIQYQHLLFLGSYIRQVDLSLDRSRWYESNKELQDYYLNQAILPKKIIDYLVVKYNLTISKIHQNNIAYRNLTLRKLIKLHLYEDELMYIIDLLSRLQSYLDYNDGIFDYNIENLRQEFAHLYSDVFEPFLNFKDKHIIERTTCFDVGFDAKCSVQEFIPDDFITINEKK